MITKTSKKVLSLVLAMAIILIYWLGVLEISTIAAPLDSDYKISDFDAFTRDYIAARNTPLATIQSGLPQTLNVQTSKVDGSNNTLGEYSTGVISDLTWEYYSDDSGEGDYNPAPNADTVYTFVAYFNPDDYPMLSEVEAPTVTVTVPAQETKTINYINASGGVTSQLAEKITYSDFTIHLVNGWYYVEGSLELNTVATAIYAEDDSSIILCDDATLEIDSDSNHAININENKSLSIYAQSDGASMGTLTTMGGLSGQIGYPGITCETGRTLSIYGGKITATGISGSAGIGAGRGSIHGTISIYGGIVEATGGASAAGIGSSYNANGVTEGIINIYGGTVTATGGSEIGMDGGGAGIGGGSAGVADAGLSAGTITINGGMVTATGQDGGEDIGKGVSGEDGTIIINGGSVNMNSGTPPSEIKNSSDTTVYLNTLTAPVSNVPITGGSVDGTAMTDDASGGAYGKKDVRTDNSGNLYFWLPQSDSLSSVSVRLENEYDDNDVYSAIYSRGTESVEQELSSSIYIDIEDEPAFLAYFMEMSYGYATPPNELLFTVENTTGATINDLSTTYTTNSNFSVTSSAVNSLTPGGTTSFTIGPAVGLNPSDYIQEVKIQSGETTLFTIIYDFEVTSHTLNTENITFGSVPLGYTPSPQNIVINNSGNRSATIESIEVSGNAFEIGDGSFTVPSSGSINRTIQPLANLPAGTYTETITITYNNNAVETASVTFTVKEFEIDEHGVLTEYYGQGGAVVIPANVTRIDNRAFAQSGVTSVTFASDTVLEGIGGYAFDGCTGITAIDLPDGITYLEEGAFFNCSIEEITIPSSVIGIGARAFSSSVFKKFVVETGNAKYISKNDLLYSKDQTSLICYPQGRAGESFTIPNNVTVISEYAFFGCSSLQKVVVPDSVKKIEANAFRSCSNLADIEIRDSSNMTDLGLHAFVGCEKLVVFLPSSLVKETIQNAFVDEGLPMSGSTITVYAYYDSDIAQWCRENGHSYKILPSSAEMQANPPQLMYEMIPYRFTVQTRVPNNEGLRFWLEIDGEAAELPAGLKLADGVTIDPQYPNITPGTIYGAPLDYKAFEDGVTFTINAQNIGSLGGLFTATAEITIKLAERLTDEQMEVLINAYPFVTDPKTGKNGKIDQNITGDRNSAIPDQTMYIGGEFRFFEGFMIDGNLLVFDTDYKAEDGSTRITIMAQTIQKLDNGTHVAAATFRRADDSGELDIVAQNFTVNLTDSNENPNPGYNHANSDYYNWLYFNGENTNQSNAADDEPEELEGELEPEDDEPEETNSENQDEEEPDPDDDDDNLNVDTSVDIVPADNNLPVDDIQSANGETENQGAIEITGLDTDENGNYLFNLDGSGTPMKTRINIPLEEFSDLYVNGELWAQGVDYRTDSGSTVLTVSASRLKELGAGSYIFQAVFNELIVEFTLLLTESVVAETTVTVQSETATTEESEKDAINVDTDEVSEDDSDKNNAIPIAIGVTAFLLLAAACGVIVKRRKEMIKK